MNAIISLAIQKRYSVDALRMYKAVAIVEAKQIHHLPSGNYEVVSQCDPNHRYQVNPRFESCNCPDCEKNGNVCKHLLAWKLIGKTQSDIDAQAEERRGLELAENIIANLPSQEAPFERIADALAYGRRCIMGGQESDSSDALDNNPKPQKRVTYDELFASFEKAKADARKTGTPRIALIQRDVIAEREAAAKASRPARGEWVEELEYA